MSITTILYLLAFLCFMLAALNVSAPVNLTALGLAFYMATLLIGG